MEKIPPSKPTYDLDKIRALFPVTKQGLIYLNHAGISPLPTPVQQCMQDTVNGLAESGGVYFQSINESLMAEVLYNIGHLINIPAQQVSLHTNTSTGLNMLANSLPLKPGNNILLCDVEFPANVYPWMNLQKSGIETRLITAHNGGLTIDGLDAQRDEQSRVVAVSAVQFFTGKRENLKMLGEYCKSHDLWLIVDAIQAAGIVPIDMLEMGIHALAAGGQKALLGPPGQGFLAVREDLLEQLEPVFVGPKSVDNWRHWLKYDMTPRPGARRFDMGTSNLVGMAGLNAAVKLLLDIGIKNIYDWVTHLSNITIADMITREYQIVTPVEPAAHANIVTVAWHGDHEAATEYLSSQGIIIRAHQDTAGNSYLRISTHCYNTEDEVIRVGEALEGLK